MKIITTILAIVLPFLMFSQKEVEGKVTAGDSVKLKVSYVLPTEHPSIEVLFKAEHPNGFPYWGLEKEELQVFEANKECEIIYLKHFGNEKPINIALVLDHSGSMNHSRSDIIEFFGGDTTLFYNPNDSLWIAYSKSDFKPIINLQKAVSNFVEGFDFNKDKISVYGFSTVVDLVLPLSNNKLKIKSKIDSMKAQGSTAFLDAVFMAANQLPENDDFNIIVAITDGGDNASSHTTTQIINLSNSKKLPIYCIGLGDVWELPLKSLSDSTNGFYLYTKKSSTLDSIYDLINKKIQAVYEMTYTSDNWSSDSSRDFILKFNTEGVIQLDSNFKFSLPPEVILKIEERNRLENLQLIGIGGGVFVIFLLGMGVVLFKRKKKEKIEFIRLYPNPGNGIVNLELKVPESIKELNLKVITPKGKVILSESINYDLKILNLTRLRAGLYLISISKEGYNTVSKKYFRR